MAAERSMLPMEVIAIVAEQATWSHEIERRHFFHSLVLVNKAFNDTLTPLLYKEYKHSENHPNHEQDLRSFLHTIDRNPYLAGLIQKLTIRHWCPVSFTIVQVGPSGPPLEPVGQLVSRAHNLRELRIEMPTRLAFLNQPFRELQRLTLISFDPVSLIRPGQPIPNAPFVNASDGRLDLTCLTDFFSLPKLTDLRIEAFECIGGGLLRSQKEFESSIESLQIHSGCIDTSVVSKVLESVGNLKIYRYSVLEFDYYTRVRKAHPDETPSTRAIIESLKRHDRTLKSLEITKHIGLSTVQDEVVASLHKFEELRSLCIDASMLIGRWHCSHTAEQANQESAETVVDLDRSEWRPPGELAGCLPDGLEELVLGIDDDKPDTYILDIVRGIVKQRERLSGLRRVGFFRLNASYCQECKKEHSMGPGNADPVMPRQERLPDPKRQEMLEKGLREVIGDDCLKIFTLFTYKHWPHRAHLWDGAVRHEGRWDTSGFLNAEMEG